MSVTVMYSMSASSDLWTSVDGMLVFTRVSTPPLGLSARSTRLTDIRLYPLLENLCVLLRWVSWMQQTSIFFFEELLKLSFFCRTPSAFQCTMQSIWWPVALLCPPLAIRGGSEPQSVALVGPFWGWGPGAVPLWLRTTRTAPQRSKESAPPCYRWYGDNRFSSRAKLAVSSDLIGWGFYTRWPPPQR